VTAFKKYGFGGIGTFHSYVTQFPFRGHEQTVINDEPPNKQKVINEMKQATINDLQSDLPQAEDNRALRHEDITDELILQNPFIFAMNRSKLNDIQRETRPLQNTDGHDNVLRLPRSFDLFNRRTEFPYDTIDNPMRLNPHYD